MKVVLDTHALYHAVERPGEMTATGRDVVEDPANELDAALASLGVRVVPIDVSVLRQTFKLVGFDRKDPADRIITATALVEDAVLVTRDEWIVKWPGVRTVW